MIKASVNLLLTSYFNLKKKLIEHISKYVKTLEFIALIKVL